jgi:hypothetical protein
MYVIGANHCASISTLLTSSAALPAPTSSFLNIGAFAFFQEPAIN